MKGFVHIQMKFDMNNTNAMRLFGDTLNYLVRYYVDKLDIDFDDFVVTSELASVYSYNINSASELSRLIGRIGILSYDSYSFKISINREMIVFICYMVNEFDKLVSNSRLLISPVVMNLIKIQMLNDYLYGYSTPLEKEFLKQSADTVKEQIYPDNIDNWFDVCAKIFTQADMPNDFNNRRIMFELNMDFEKNIKPLVENRLLMNGCNQFHDIYNEQCEMFNKFFSIYYKFNSIYSPRYIDNLKDSLDHEYNGLVPNMKKLLDELSNIFAIWNLTKIEAIKKYPEYKDTLKNVKFCIVNAMGMMKMINKIQPEAVFTDITYVSKKAKITVYMNLDRLLYEHVSLMYKEVPYSEKRFHHEFAFKHELGHIVHYCELRSNKKIKYVKQNLKKITETERKHWESLPVDDRLDYNYWYYTYLPFERRANELMGLTIEDVYRANFEDVPPSVKQLLEEENNNK